MQPAHLFLVYESSRSRKNPKTGLFYRRNTLRALVKDGKLPAIYVGAKVLILVKDLAIFLSLNRGVDLLNAGRVRPLKSGAYNYKKLCG